jgi:lysophospholipase L1-like esterase
MLRLQWRPSTLGLAAAMGALTFCGMATAQTRVYCMGASIAAGMNATIAYPVRLGTLLGTGTTGYNVMNGGYSGCCLLRKGALPWWTHLPSVFTYKANIVIIELGGNDSQPSNWQYGPANFGPDLAAMIDTLRHTISPTPTVYVCLTIPVFGTNQYNLDGTVVVNQIIPIIKQVAAQKNAGIIDLWTPLSTMTAHFADHVHPDDVGQDTIAHVMYRALKAPTGILEMNGIRNIETENKGFRWASPVFQLIYGSPVNALGRAVRPNALPVLATH